MCQRVRGVVDYGNLKVRVANYLILWREIVFVFEWFVFFPFSLLVYFYGCGACLLSLGLFDMELVGGGVREGKVKRGIFSLRCGLISLGTC